MAEIGLEILTENAQIMAELSSILVLFLLERTEHSIASEGGAEYRYPWLKRSRCCL